MACAQVEDSLSCSVCAEKYDNHNHVPKILPCQHTFCGSCIDAVILRADDDDAKCPVCRAPISSPADVRTNLAVREIAEAIAKTQLGPLNQAAEQSSKLPCSVHPSAECVMFCIDCCESLCEVCMRKSLTRSSHQSHAVSDIEEAKTLLKERFTALVHDKIRKLQDKSGALRSGMGRYSQEIDAITSMMTSTVDGWRGNLLQDRPDVIQKAETCDEWAAYWKQKLNLTEFKAMLRAYNEVKDETACESISPLNRHLTIDNIKELRQDMLSIFDAIEASMTHATPAPSHRRGDRPQYATQKGANYDQPKGMKRFFTFSNSASPSPQPSFRLQEVRGDIFSAPNRFSLVCRTSADLQMKSGCARQFKQRFGGLNVHYGPPPRVGEVVSEMINKGRYVYYLIDKKSERHFSSLDIMKRCLFKLRDQSFVDGVMQLAMPTIGCGGDKLNWSDVRRIIQEVFSDTAFEIIVYY